MQERNTTLTPKGAGISYSALIIVYVVISLIGGMLIGILGVKENTATYYALSVCLGLLSIALVFVFSAKMTKTDIISLTGIQKFSPIYIPIAIVIAVGMFLGFGFMNDKFAKFIVSIGGAMPTSNVVGVIDSVGTFVLFSVLIGIMPAVVEEIFFRGLLVRSLKSTGRFFTVVMVAISFALYHGSVVQFIYQLIYGGVLTLLTIKAKSTIPSMIAHFINNFLILVLSYFFNMNNAVSNVYLIVLGIVLVVGAVLFLSLYKKEKGEPVVKGDRKAFVLFALPGLLISLVIAITGVIPA